MILYFLARRLCLITIICGGMTACADIGENIPDQQLNLNMGRNSMPKFRPASVVSPPSENTPLINRSREVLVKGDNIIAGPLGDNQTPGAKVDGGYVLNFDGVDVRDVAKAVLGDQLGINYVVDPAVKGTVTLHTSSGLPRNNVLPALTEAFRAAGVALISQKTGYLIAPLAGAAQRSQLYVDSTNPQAGYQVRIVPLRFLIASNIERALEPLVPPGTIIPGDGRASFLILSGSQTDLDRAERAVTIFDVDWLRKQSFGLFPLKYSSAKNVANDLTAVIGKQGIIQDSVQVTAIDHLNSILVTSNNYNRVTQMKTWIERFDRGKDLLKPKVFIYHVQNSSARNLAAILSKVFSSSESSSTKDSADQSSAVNTANSQPNSATAVSSTPGNFVPTNLPSESTVDDRQTDKLKITADEVNNSLIIVATPETYSRVESALAQLDTAPLQVLIEATIAEVDITDTFQYGVQTSIHTGALSVLSSNVAPSNIAANTGGLSVVITKSNISAALNLLSTLTKTKVISSPQLLVVNNKAASIQVGDQVPIATASAISTQSSGAPIVNTIQMLDTGIILHVTPRVNSNGQVLMELNQEVSATVPTVSSNIDSPTIQQRRLTTTVQIDDGQTIIIGGLISDTRGRNRTGVPILKDVPVLGNLFGTTSDTTKRTELMVLLTPRVVRNGAEADQASAELEKKMLLLRQIPMSHGVQ